MLIAHVQPTLTVQLTSASQTSSAAVEAHALEQVSPAQVTLIAVQAVQKLLKPRMVNPSKFVKPISVHVAKKPA